MEERAQRVPGVHREIVREAQDLVFRTGVPAFLGHAEGPTAPLLLTRAAQFPGPLRLPDDSLLAPAIHGFFAAGGQRCFVLPVAPAAGHVGHLVAARQLGELEEIDLLCAPDLLRPFTNKTSDAALAELVATQAQLIVECTAARCLMLVDGPPGRAQAQAHATALRARLDALGPGSLRDAALYFPWVRAPGAARFAPPCGHVAGTIARLDAQEGVHRAPAGLELGGACDLGEPVDDGVQRQMTALGVNCIRAFRGRGLRIWGARTLSRDEAWQPIPVRRLVSTIGRWLELRLADFAFESNDSMTWNRLDREVGAYLDGLHAAGALRGRVAAEAYFIKCDAETNPPEVRDAGMLVAEIGVAPLVPQEFIALRLIQRGGGLSLTDAAG
ncbi:MAG TPA: phage tail sheath subtilisin-like domain-containing protein [Nannocystis sp.]|jgi:hypothetical protein